MSCFIEALYFGSIPTENRSFQNFQTLTELFGIFEREEELTIKEDILDKEIIEDDSTLEDTGAYKTIPERLWMNLKHDENTNENTSTVFGNEKEVNLLRIDGNEVFVVKTIEENSYNKPSECILCSEMLSMHRIDLNNDEDRQSYGISDISLQHVYKCCVDDCTKVFKSVKHFNLHQKFKHKLVMISPLLFFELEFAYLCTYSTPLKIVLNLARKFQYNTDLKIFKLKF